MALEENPNGSNFNNLKKVLVIGDEGCGKTSLIFYYLEKPLPDGIRKIPSREYAVKIFDAGEDPYDTIIWDVPMSEQHTERRVASYGDSHVVLLCFAINEPLSLEHACSRWLNEVKQFTPETDIILVGLKKDLRPSASEGVMENPTCVSFQDAYDRKEIHGFKVYLECSTKTGEGIFDVFKTFEDILASQGIWL